MSFDLQSDIECGVWDPMNPINIVFSTEDGFVSQLDARNLNFGYLFHSKAHEKSVTGVSLSHQINGLMGTCSLDGKMKIWDTTQIKDNEPKLIASKPAKAVKYLKLNKKNNRTIRENYIVDLFAKIHRGFSDVEVRNLI